MKGGSPLHILHGVLSLDVGGLERIVLDLVRAGRGAGHRISVVCIERPGALAEAAHRYGADVRSLDKPAGRIPATVAKAAGILSELRPDVVHTHQAGALWYLGQAARASGQIPVLHTEHGNHIAQAPSLMGRLKTRLLIGRAARLAGAFCCVSEDIARTVIRLRTIPRGKVRIILNGIRTDAFDGRAEVSAVRRELEIPPEAPVIGTVGRLAEIKRQGLLLRACARLQGSFPELRVLLVGDGPERERLEKEATRLGIEDRVHFAGYQPNPERFLQAMNLFVLTSRSEGLPVSLLEAWATGLPVVSSAVGGIPKLVADGKTGLLFPSGDLEALVNSIQTVLANSELAANLGHAGRAAVVEHYSLERMAAQYEQLYRTLLAADRERA
jgi:glycosyltransferase involved in cell wall biosynthesis